MGFFDKVQGLWWDFWLTPYFKVFIMKKNIVVKVFNQRVVNSQKGSNFAVIDRPNKIAWWVTEDFIVHKARIIIHVDIDNAIPLRIEEKKEISGNIILKEKTTRKMIVDKEKQKKEYKNGLPNILSEIHFPSIVLFQMIEAHFVVETLSEPPSKWAELKWVFIAAIIAGAFLLWQLMGSGIVGGGVK